MAMPRLTGGRSLTRLPSMMMSPEVTSSRPAIIRSNVDLPQPEGPTKTTNSPLRTSSSMPLRTSNVAEGFLKFVEIELSQETVSGRRRSGPFVKDKRTLRRRAS